MILTAADKATVVFLLLLTPTVLLAVLPSPSNFEHCLSHLDFDGAGWGLWCPDVAATTSAFVPASDVSGRNWSYRFRITFSMCARVDNCPISPAFAAVRHILA